MNEATNTPIRTNVPGSTGSAYTAPGGFLQIKAEPVSNIRGPRGRGIQRGRVTYQNRGGGCDPNARSEML